MLYEFMFSAVYRVTQKDFYARPYLRMRDLRHNSDNDDLELITPHMLINTWQGQVTLYTFENINS